ncbi:reverse transcriptase zinc-binding domain-containing protein [Tanacetum coccineum]
MVFALHSEACFPSLVSYEKMPLRSWDVDASTDLSQLRCLLCGSHQDTHEHLFFECTFSSQVWNSIRNLAGMEHVPPILEDIVMWFNPMANNRSFKNVVGKLLFAASSYYIWIERNNRLFKNSRRSPEEIRDLIMTTVRLKLVTFRFKNTSRVQSLLSLWKMPSNFRIYGC